MQTTRRAFDMGLAEITTLPGVTLQCGIDLALELVDDRDATGSAHLEVALAGSLYPMMTLLLKGSMAVIMRIDADGGDVMIAEGDGSVAPAVAVEFDSPVGREPFTGEVILADSLARDALRAFMDSQPWPDGIRWRTV